MMTYKSLIVLAATACLPLACGTSSPTGPDVVGTESSASALVGRPGVRQSPLPVPAPPTTPNVPGPAPVPGPGPAPVPPTSDICHAATIDIKIVTTSFAAPGVA